jgi:hypothetical protein
MYMQYNENIIIYYNIICAKIINNQRAGLFLRGWKSGAKGRLGQYIRPKIK